MKNQADYWIDHLKLDAHPEGGYYKEVYRNPHTIQIRTENRNLATSIYFLLKGNQKSHFHQLESDELWYFHAGSAVAIHIFEKKEYRKELLGSNLSTGESLQILLPAHSIFGAEVADKGSFCLMGCMVNPGFDFRDFRLVEKAKLLKDHPEHSFLIQQFTLR